MRKISFSTRKRAEVKSTGQRKIDATETTNAPGEPEAFVVSVQQSRDQQS
jgi:hypothetical protein